MNVFYRETAATPRKDAFLDITLPATYSQDQPKILSIFVKYQQNSGISVAAGSRVAPQMIEKDSRDRTVLIVEDIDDARYFMRLELEQLGYLVLEAENGRQAVEIAEREQPDIILMDLSLPLMDGISATEKIRASKELKTVPIIAVTAHQETDFRAGARAAGFDAYVTKPIDIDWLSELIRGLLV